MNGADVALDTNQAIAVLDGTGDTALWLRTLTGVYLPVPVIGELRFGALNSQRAARSLRRVEQLVSRCQVLNAIVSTAEVYARIRLQLKRKGKPIPENDLWIAAPAGMAARPPSSALRLRRPTKDRTEAYNGA